MANTGGTRLGSYEVAEPLGVGGMGEVYRATDLKLKREVALKVLPASFAADADRLARFQREAELLASLNHPNIAQIYGIEIVVGVEFPEPVTALVMELIEGPTLAECIEQGALPTDEALNVAMQIANVLEAAHARGSGWVMLTPLAVAPSRDGPTQDRPQRINVVMNWFRELEQRVPTAH